MSWQYKLLSQSLAAMLLPLSTALAGDLPRKPNILFIMADDHSAAAISTYDSKVNQTPNIDRLANQGMRFNHVYCVNSITTPSTNLKRNFTVEKRTK